MDCTGDGLSRTTNIRQERNKNRLVNSIFYLKTNITNYKKNTSK